MKMTEHKPISITNNKSELNRLVNVYYLCKDLIQVQFFVCLSKSYCDNLSVTKLQPLIL